MFHYLKIIFNIAETSREEEKAKRLQGKVCPLSVDFLMGLKQDGVEKLDFLGQACGLCFQMVGLHRVNPPAAVFSDAASVSSATSSTSSQRPATVPFGLPFAAIPFSQSKTSTDERRLKATKAIDIAKKTLCGKKKSSTTSMVKISSVK